MARKSKNVFDISLLGDKALAKKFELLGKESAQRKVLRKPLREGAKIVLKAAKSRVPSKFSKERKLKRSLKVKALKRSRIKFGSLVITGSREKLDISPSDLNYYPQAVEFGYSTAKRTVPAQSFLRSAAYDNKSKVLNSIRIGIKKNMEIMAKKLGAKK